MSQDLKCLSDKVVAVTGGAQGIGYEIAEQFLRNNAKVVVLLDIHERKGKSAEKALNNTFGEKRAVFYKCDVTKDLEEAYNKIFNEFKKIDVLVNNAGLVDEMSVKRTIETNTVSVMEWTMKFFEHMRADNGGNGGTIINVASMYGFIVDPYLPFYKASKFAVVGFTKSLGHEMNFNKFGVRILALCPGFTETQLGSGLRVTPMLLRDEFLDFIDNVEWQKTEAVGKATVQIFEEADSGTAWYVLASETPKRVADTTLSDLLSG